MTSNKRNRSSESYELDLYGSDDAWKLLPTFSDCLEGIKYWDGIDGILKISSISSGLLSIREKMEKG